jgi:hypothetical protein
MADIRTQRTRPLWPWVIAGLVLLAIILWLILGRGDRAPATDPLVGDPAPTAVDPAVPPPPAAEPDPAPATVAGAPAPVNQFLSYTQELRARPAVEITHEHTAEGLRHLADALAAMAQRDQIVVAEIEEQVSVLRKHADALQQEPEAARHPAHAREAMLGAVKLMEVLQTQRYPQLEQEVAQARNAATDIQAGVQLPEQADDVQRFFNRSAQVVHGMAAAA